MPIPVATSEELKDESGKKTFLARCMGDSVMVSEYPQQTQRYAICNYSYTKSKEKSTKASLANEINQSAVTNCLVKIKTNNLNETALFQENLELAANYLNKSGLKKYATWHLSVDPNKEETDASRFSNCFTSNFQDVDISALENIMEIAASVDDKDLANKASELLALALKKKNGENLSTYTFIPGMNSVTLEASI